MTKKTMAVCFLLFLVLLLAIPTIYIVMSPDDVPQSKPDNSVGNLQNGGAIVSDEVTYYIADGTLYQLFNDQVKSLVENAAAPLFLTEGGVAFSRDGGLWQVSANGGNLTCLLEQTENPLVVGRWIYDTQDGALYKTRMDDGKRFDLGLYPVGPYFISATRIFYLGQDSCLYTAKTDGSENVRFTDYPATDFVIGDNYAFFRNGEGLLQWCSLEDTQALVSLRRVDSYNYVNGYLIYVAEGELHAMDLTGLQDQVITQEPVVCLSTDDSYLYYFNGDGALTRMLPDGSGKTVF